MNTLTNPQLLNFLNAALAAGTADLQQAVNDYVRTAIEHSSHELRDAYMNDWFAHRAGRSLLAWRANGTLLNLFELPTTQADGIHELDPHHTLIVATWPGGAP